MSKWIEWNGGECPVADNVCIEILFRAGYKIKTTEARSWCWNHLPEEVLHKIIAYKIVD